VDLVGFGGGIGIPLREPIPTASAVALNSRLVLRRISSDSPVMEIVFSVTQENDGGYMVECLSHDIFTQGNT
jgi:hypothetical protein